MNELLGEQSMKNFQFKKFRLQKLTGQLKSNLQHASTFQFQQLKQAMLVVEDSEMIQTVIEKQLEMLNVDYFKAKDGIEAIEKVEQQLEQGKMFDIILMDLYMPNMNGFQATEGIRELEEKYGIAPEDKHFICAHSSELSR